MHCKYCSDGTEILTNFCSRCGHEREDHMHRRTWQKFEQRVAKFFGCGRTGPMQEKDANDIDHPHIHCQCKHSNRHAILTIWDAAKRATKKSGKIPIVTIGQQGRPGFWILVKESDLVAIANQRSLVIKENT
jgi:hypothetical protein